MSVFPQGNFAIVAGDLFDVCVWFPRPPNLSWMQVQPINIKKRDTTRKWKSFTPQLGKAALESAEGMKR